jgi:hypothetical protein
MQGKVTCRLGPVGAIVNLARGAGELENVGSGGSSQSVIFHHDQSGVALTVRAQVADEITRKKFLGEVFAPLPDETFLNELLMEFASAAYGSKGAGSLISTGNDIGANSVPKWAVHYAVRGDREALPETPAEKVVCACHEAERWIEPVEVTAVGLVLGGIVGVRLSIDVVISAVVGPRIEENIARVEDLYGLPDSLRCERMDQVQVRFGLERQAPIAGARPDSFS